MHLALVPVREFPVLLVPRRKFGGGAKAGPVLGITTPAAMRSYLDFEKPVAELEAKVLELRQLAEKGDAVAIGEELTRLEAKAEKALADLYANLTPWQKTLVARHKERPHFSDFVKVLVRRFHATLGRPAIWRGRRDRRRFRLVSRPFHLRPRPRKRLRHRSPDQA